MARAPDYKPFDHMGAARAVGGAIGDIPGKAVSAFASGVRTQQGMESAEQAKRSNELKIKEQHDRINEARKNKKLFEQEKQGLIDEWRGNLKNAPNDWAEKQLKYIETAKNVDELVERNSNLATMLQANQDVKKKYPYLSLQNPDPAGAGSILGKGAADQYINSLNDLAVSSSRQFIGKSVKQILSENPNLNEEQAMRKFAEMHKVDEVALDKEARQIFKDAYVSQGQQMAAQTARINAQTKRQKAGTRQNLATNKAFTRLNSEENKLSSQVLRETNIDVSKLDDMGQFYDLKEWTALGAEKKEKVSTIIKKLDDVRTKKQIVGAARSLGLSVDDTQAQNVLEDIMDPQRESTGTSKQIADYMSQRGFKLPKQSPGGEKDPDETTQTTTPSTDDDLVKQLVKESQGRQ